MRRDDRPAIVSKQRLKQKKNANKWRANIFILFYTYMYLILSYFIYFCISLYFCFTLSLLTSQSVKPVSICLKRADKGNLSHFAKKNFF